MSGEVLHVQHDFRIGSGRGIHVVVHPYKTIYTFNRLFYLEPLRQNVQDRVFRYGTTGYRSKISRLRIIWKYNHWR